MVTIRLKRFGKKHSPVYRIVVADGRAPREGRTLDELGYYIPERDPSEIKLDSQKYLEWIEKGAQPTRTVQNLAKIAMKNT